MTNSRSNLSRRRFLAASAAGIAFAGCQSKLVDCPPVDCDQLITSVNRALARSAAFLLDRQEPDGAWRRSIYGFMKDGPSLTPHVLTAILFLPQAGSRATVALTHGVDYLAALINSDGEVPDDLNLVYPIYTAADTVRLLSHAPRHAPAQAAWAAFIRGRQLNEDLGWSPEDMEYGGWSYAVRPPHKSANGTRGPWDFSNLSATLYGLAALAGAHVRATDKSYAQARVFVQRCQNYTEPRNPSARAFDDGGFYFCPADPLHNKAGMAGTDGAGRLRFNSYGSMTCDGLRALLASGLPPSHPRILAAQSWLYRNLDARPNLDVRHNPGRFASGTEDLRDATYYYYCWSLAHAAMRFPDVPPREPRDLSGVVGQVEVAVALIPELLARQREDGAWVNRFTDAKEDDPLVATPLAASALAICQHILYGRDVAIELPGNL
jgi:hypothetical protein